MLLNFIGDGSAFNTKRGNSSAYFVRNDELFLIDCGSDVFAKIKDKEFLTKAKEINIFITHLHSDHVGSLGDLILYSFFILKKKVKIYFPEEYRMKTYLDLVGCTEYYDYYPDYRDWYDEHDWDEVFFERNNHVKEIPSYSIIIDFSGVKYFYSGDISNFDYSEIECESYQEVYIDTCIADYPNNVHTNIHKFAPTVPEYMKDNIYCYHLDNNDELLKIIKGYGFNLVKQ